MATPVRCRCGSTRFELVRRDTVQHYCQACGLSYIWILRSTLLQVGQPINPEAITRQTADGEEEWFYTGGYYRGEK